MKAALLALLLAAAPPAEMPVEGVWKAQMPETAAFLELDANGRFGFFFSQGALDATGEGRWERSGDRLLLTSDPHPVPPRTTLLGSGSDGEPGLLVRIVAADGKPVSLIDLFAEHPGGEVSHGLVQSYPGGEYRFEGQPPVKAVAVGSLIYDFDSPSFPVPSGANVMRFRFEPNDYAKVDFAALPVTIEADGSLLLNWRGVDLRYRRHVEEPTDDRPEEQD